VGGPYPAGYTGGTETAAAAHKREVNAMGRYSDYITNFYNMEDTGW